MIKILIKIKYKNHLIFLINQYQNQIRHKMLILLACLISLIGHCFLNPPVVFEKCFSDYRFWEMLFSKTDCRFRQSFYGLSESTVSLRLVGLKWVRLPAAPSWKTRCHGNREGMWGVPDTFEMVPVKRARENPMIPIPLNPPGGCWSVLLWAIDCPAAAALLIDCV